MWDEEDERYKRIDLDQVLYVRSEGKYCRVYALKKEKFFMTKCTMKNFLKIINGVAGPIENNAAKNLNNGLNKNLPIEGPFCQIHKQYIIPLNQIDYPTEDLTTVVLKCNEELPIGRAYLPWFKKVARVL